MSDLPNDDAAGGEEFDLPLDDGGGEEGEPPEGEEAEDEPPEEGDEEGEGEGEGEPAPAQRRHRPGRNERLREQVARLEGRLAELSRQPPAPQPAPDPGAEQRARQQFLAELEVLPPAEAAARVMDLGRQEFGNAFNRLRAEMRDEIDKQAYEARMASSAPHRRHAERIEQGIAELRRRGDLTTNRTTLLKLFLGDERLAAEDRAGRSAPRQRRAAAARVAAQTTRPGGTRSDGGQGRRPAADSIEAVRARIAGKPLWDS